MAKIIELNKKTSKLPYRAVLHCHEGAAVGIPEFVIWLEKPAGEYSTTERDDLIAQILDAYEYEYPLFDLIRYCNSRVSRSQALYAMRCGDLDTVKSFLLLRMDIYEGVSE